MSISVQKTCYGILSVARNVTAPLATESDIGFMERSCTVECNNPGHENSTDNKAMYDIVHSLSKNTVIIFFGKLQAITGSCNHQGMTRLLERESDKCFPKVTFSNVDQLYFRKYYY